MNRNAIAALTATTFLVAGCSGAPEQVTVTETVEAPEATEAPKAEEEPTKQAKQDAAGEAEHVDRQSGIPDAPLAYPGAGGPVPDNARPIPDDQEHRR
ncbi:hypothetical protein [Corynebacterium haemomassiliense]|uniref:Lipoprotein n=1 Tax=Corynebacterium haemomassiliense TaxID=2754726 RepID=A0A7W2ECV9_9CORY|nr:hypothetical protein [Corynebacterium haemomassiliense]MBA5245413.1 hypothetical protein [Corynebacterium haemomassiliense]